MSIAVAYSGFTPAAWTAGTHLSIDALSCVRSASGRRLFLARQVDGQLGQALADRLVGQRLDQRVVDLGDDCPSTCPSAPKKPFQIVTS